MSARKARAAVRRARHVDSLREQLAKAIRDRLPALAELLADYEATGDHNHGPRALGPGETCPGGDCLVYEARRLLAEMRPTATVTLTLAELRLLESALDSHIYWQLTEDEDVEHWRNSGYVCEPEDAEVPPSIRKARDLEKRLNMIARQLTPPEAPSKQLKGGGQ